MFNISKKSLSLAILTSLLMSNAQAVQFVDGADGKHVQINISGYETNRLSVEGRDIVKIVPSRNGVVDAKKDATTGAVYLAFKDAQEQGTVTLFVTDAEAVTYTLLAVPRSMAAEEVIIRAPAAKKKAAATTTTHAARAVSYQRRIKDLVLIMADDNPPSSIDVEEINKEVPLWQEGVLTFVAKYSDGALVGEKYQLRNISEQSIGIVEQEFYRPGVVAVSVEYQALDKGQSTAVLVVRERGENE